MIPMYNTIISGKQFTIYCVNIEMFHYFGGQRTVNVSNGLSLAVS